jgi:primase-polymerase (primpol)-like protein
VKPSGAAPQAGTHSFRKLEVALLRTKLPLDLRTGRLFVVWCEEIRKGKATKVPINPHTLAEAKTNDPATWGTFEEAVACYQAHSDILWGIGRVIDPADDLTGVDLDDCLDEDGNFLLDHPAAKSVARLNSYTERSPSRRGAKVWVRAKHSLGGRKTGRKNKERGVELNRGGYFTLTADILPQFSNRVEHRQAEIDELYREMFGENEPGPGTPFTSDKRLSDADILRRARSAKSGNKFSALWSGDTSRYPTQSEADAALCALLWTAAGDREAVERLFGQSALAKRDKWRHKDYRNRTLDFACKGRLRSAGASLPLADYVALAIRRNEARFAARSKWGSALFHFARLLKGRSELQTLRGIEAAAAIDPVLTALATGSDDA